ncbi:MAG: ComEC/Rec2 family competence protein [Bulleidia sp.]
MTSLRENPILFAVILFLFSCGVHVLPWTSVVLLSVFWLFRTKDRSVLIVLACMALIALPRFSEERPGFTEGVVVEIRSSSAILQKANTRFVVYTDQDISYGEVYTFQPYFSKVETMSSFYGYDSRAALERSGVYYRLDSTDLTYVRSFPSLRGFLYHRIQKISDPLQQEILKKVLLNISTKDGEYDFLSLSGFSWAGILYVIRSVLKYILDRNTRTKVMLVLDSVFWFSFGFPLPVFYRLVSDGMRLFPSDRYERCGFTTSVVLCLYPSSVFSPSFLIPAVYRITNCVCEKGNCFAMTFLLMFQSLTYSCMNPLRNLLYGVLMKGSGILFFIGLLCLFTGNAVPSVLLSIPETIHRFLSVFEIPGNIKGIGSVFFALLIWTFRHREHYDRYVLTSLLVFQLLGLFHPFAEISFINVGQGDAIYIQGPFHTSRILIDTGKETAYDRVDTFLKANGVSSLTSLIITHSDSDHAANRDRIIQEYNPEQVIETHVDEIHDGIYTLYDLNPIMDADENRSSLMHVFSINGLNVLLTGDGDSESEEAILKAHPDLSVDVLKAGHHGSKTATSDRFLDTIRPSSVMISAGSPSLYHHPSDEMIQRLLKRHIPYFNTFETGDITIVCLFRFNLLFTSGGIVSLL